MKQIWEDTEPIFPPGEKPSGREGVLLLFSGGTDSVFTALHLGRQFKRIVLLTCCPHYVLRPRSLTRPAVAALREFFPNVEISQVFADPSGLRRRLAPFRAVRQGKTTFLFCTACKLSMHLKSIEVCRREGLHWASSGSTPREQMSYPDQFPELQALIDRLYETRGIKRVGAAKGLTKKDEKDYLRGCGLRGKVKQPVCLVSRFQTLAWLFLGFPRQKVVLDWYRSSLPRVEKLLSETIGPR